MPFKLTFFIQKRSRSFTTSERSRRRLAARLDVSEQIENLFLGQNAHQTLGHGGKFRWPAFLDLALPNLALSLLQWISDDDDPPTVFFDDSADNIISVLQRQRHVLILLGDDFRRVNDRFQNVAPGVFARRRGQFRTDGAAFVAEAMAGNALCVV